MLYIYYHHHEYHHPYLLYWIHCNYDDEYEKSSIRMDSGLLLSLLEPVAAEYCNQTVNLSRMMTNDHNNDYKEEDNDHNNDYKDEDDKNNHHDYDKDDHDDDKDYIMLKINNMIIEFREWRYHEELLMLTIALRHNKRLKKETLFMWIMKELLR